MAWHAVWYLTSAQGPWESSISGAPLKSTGAEQENRTQTGRNTERGRGETEAEREAGVVVFLGRSPFYSVCTLWGWILLK
jgi:hypothetical protein